MNTHDPKYKHKPSEKHTLEEVLKSLQDMIRNDLREADQNAAPAETSRPSAPAAADAQRREAAPAAREDFAPTSPGTGPVNLDAVVRSLKDIINNELDVGDPPASLKSAPPPADQTASDEIDRQKIAPAERPLISAEPDKPRIVEGAAPAGTPTPVSMPADADEEIEIVGSMPLAAEPIFEALGELSIDNEFDRLEIAPAEKSPISADADKQSSVQKLAPPEAPTLASSPSKPDADEEIEIVDLTALEGEPVSEEPDELSIDIEHIIDKEDAAPDKSTLSAAAPHAAEARDAERPTPVEAKPEFEAPAELGIGDAFVPPVDEPPVQQPEAEALFGGHKPLDEGSIFEQPIELSLDEEHANSASTTPSAFEPPTEFGVGEDFAPPVDESPILQSEADTLFGGHPPPDEGSIFEQPIELSLDEEHTSSETAGPPQHSEEIDGGVNFEPLDEALTHIEPQESIAPAPAAPGAPELPGEIAAEMLDAPEELTAPAVSAPEDAKHIMKGIQQAFSLDEFSPGANEAVVSSRNFRQAAEPPRMTEEFPSETTPDVTHDSPAETLPTIDGEQRLDETISRQTATPQEQAPSSDKQEIQEILASPPEPASAPELPPPDATPTAGDEIDPTQIPKISSEPKTESTATPAIKKMKLEIVEGPLMPSSAELTRDEIDFANLVVQADKSNTADKANPTSASTSKTPVTTENAQNQAAAGESETHALPPSQAAQALPSPTDQAGTLEGKPPKSSEVPTAAENRATPPAESKTGKAASAKTSHPDTALQKTATQPTSDSKPGVQPAATEIDDIPVLNQVVTPMAGDRQTANTASPLPPLPSPDRAHNIVVRAVAKLNVEIRQAGGTGLDTKTLLRLQKLIRQELEKDRGK